MTAAGTAVRDRVRRSPRRRASRERRPPVLSRFPLPARLVGYAVVLGLGLLYLLPFVLQLVTGFKTDPDAAAHPLALLPTTPTTAAYQRLFGLSQASEGVPFLRWLSNSALVAVLVTAGRVLFDSMAGYALARLRFRGRSVLFGFVLSVMAVPGVALLIPKFLVLNTFGLFDTYTGMILPLLVDAAGIFIMKQFFESVPREVEEAARVDGAGVFRIFWSVVLPMARPALITLTILSFQGSWNEFTHFLVSTQSGQYETLTTGLARFVSGGLGGGTQYPLKLTAALLSTIPVAALFFCFQRYFVSGANEGAVKE
ncbi:MULTISPECIES: carbohydrate ABC transporter permease [unclassified Streptomyces]|uniref:carbohydrate ABC transporter permease n=1 Tax=unclassified Streptomyces TaxID=2593676 RepID=UPI002DDC5802|nr:MULTISPECIES: carbohydrate ABC transporter permease [unclassified Streptomyces]WSF89138.1 carbohydrate ABC transporter permease [Streptomyces sp. NBC_01744]WSC34693.1 carbohydrate ABC transporter permease [Streptomyces sp. NBC_01763]WSC43101.1 carbohydrate ABC transporter permease [Streptomyces sp. NBC_01762]WSC58038.1 carbohydrate ABC transporter permease [Streptomyces sp. NBC_01761]WSD22638.1 carbohydrate ABC transporter permease [Streptomyces sp. NBC_01751]